MMPIPSFPTSPETRFWQTLRFLKKVPEESSPRFVGKGYLRFHELVEYMCKFNSEERKAGREMQRLGQVVAVDIGFNLFNRLWCVAELSHAEKLPLGRFFALCPAFILAWSLSALVVLGRELGLWRGDGRLLANQHNIRTPSGSVGGGRAAGRGEEQHMCETRLQPSPLFSRLHLGMVQICTTRKRQVSAGPILPGCHVGAAISGLGGISRKP